MPQVGGSDTTSPAAPWMLVLMTDLDTLLDLPQLAVFGALVICQQCGARIVSVAAVGIAEQRIREHLGQHERPEGGAV